MLAFFSSIFELGNDPKLIVRAWQKQLRGEARVAERQIYDIRREEAKVEAAVKEAARRGDSRSVKMLAREIISSRKAVGRTYQNIAHMNSVCMMLGEQLATIRAVGHLKKSAGMLKAMNALLSGKDRAGETIHAMAREMTKNGIIDEMMNDALDEVTMTDDMEAETDAEVNRVMEELKGRSPLLPDVVAHAERVVPVQIAPILEEKTARVNEIIYA